MGSMLSRFKNAREDGLRNLSSALMPNGEVQPTVPISLAVPPDTPTDVSIFLPVKKKEDRPQPEGASFDTTAGNATAGSALSECSQIVMEQAPKSGGTRPRSPGRSPGTDLLDARIVMGEENHCLGVAVQDTPSVPELGVSETTSGEEMSDVGDEGLDAAFQGAPLPPVAKDFGNLHACTSVSPPGLLKPQEPAGMGVSPLSQGEPMADVPSPSPTLAKDLPAELAESQLFLAKHPCSLDPELYFTAPSTPIQTAFPPLRQLPFWKDGLSEEQNEIDSEGLCSPPTSPSGSYITAEGGSWTSTGTASTSSSCSPNLLADAEALEAPMADKEASSELDLPEGEPKLSGVTCPTFGSEGAFPGLSFDTFPLSYPVEECSRGEEEERSPSEEGWGCETTPLELVLQEVEQTYPSWPPNGDESEDDADLSSSPLAYHECLLPSDDAEVGFTKRVLEACPFACPLTAVSGPPSELQGVFGVGPAEAGEPDGLQSQPPTSSLEDGMKTIKSDQMIPALLLPFCGSLLFDVESMEITLFPQGEVVENDALYGVEDDDSTSVSFLHSLSETSIDEGVDESFAYPDDTSQSSDSASDDGKDGVEQYSGVADAVVQSKEDLESAPPHLESEMDVSSDAYNTDEDTVHGTGEEQTTGESEEKGTPKEEKLMQEDPMKPPRSFDTTVVSRLQARPESPGGASSRSTCISHPGPGEEDSVVASEDLSPPTQDDKEESLEEMVLSHISPTHLPHSDVQPTHLESGVSECGECLIACFDTDDESDNQPPLTDTAEESPSVGPLAEEWMGQVCAGSVIPLEWNPESCPVELEDLEAIDNHDSSSLDIGARLEESEKRLLELLDQDGAASGSSAKLEPGDGELLETSSEKERPFASLLESKGALLEQPEVIRADAKTTQDSLVVCLESEDKLEEASSLDQITNNEDCVMVAAFSEAKPDSHSLLALSNTPENILAEDNGVQESPLFPPDGEEAAELQNWS